MKQKITAFISDTIFISTPHKPFTNPLPYIKSFNTRSMYMKTFTIHVDYNQNVKYDFCKQKCMVI